MEYAGLTHSVRPPIEKIWLAGPVEGSNFVAVVYV